MKDKYTGTIGEKIKRARKIKHMTQKELDKLGSISKEIIRKNQ